MLPTIERLASSRLLTEVAGVDVQPDKGVAGSNAFAHEAGIRPESVRKDAPAGTESNRAFARFEGRTDRTRRVTDDDRAAIADAGLSPSVRGGTRKEGRS